MANSTRFAALRLSSRLGAIALCLLLSWETCLSDEHGPVPASDPENRKCWRLNQAVSDEFESSELDGSKWLVQGKDGEYKNAWRGRAPSQFVPENVRIENGKLKLQTRWQPDFEFSTKLYQGKKYENITTAAVIARRPVHFGYLEIKCKAANAPITSSFWATGHRSELDVFEFFGRTRHINKPNLSREFICSIIDWDSGESKKTWSTTIPLEWRFTDDFHVYGCEWSPNVLKFFADGKLIDRVTRAELGEGWALIHPLSVWVDSETFPWHGLPNPSDLPADFEIDYIRVWQRNRLEDLFHGFESPITIGDKAHEWWSPNRPPVFKVVDDGAASGKSALCIKHEKPIVEETVIFAPLGSLQAETGTFTFSMRVFVEPNPAIRKLQVILQDPWLELRPFDISSIPTGKWSTVTQEVVRKSPSGSEDRIRIVVRPEDSIGPRSRLLIDELRLVKKAER